MSKLKLKLHQSNGAQVVGEMNSKGENAFLQMFKEINDEFDQIETFVESDEKKSERFKHYLKHFYDYLKINQNEDNNTSTTATTTVNQSQYSLPELIVDTRLVDNEQIYQQLQLYNNEDQCSIQHMTKFFAKCLLNKDNLTFNVDTRKTSANGTSGVGGERDKETTDNFDSNDDQENEREEDGDYDEDDEDDQDSDDSLDHLIKSKLKSSLKKDDTIKIANKKSETTTSYGIPDGSDSEISDFEVNENGDEDDDDDDENEDEDELGEEFEDDEDEGDWSDNEDDSEEKKMKKIKNKDKTDDDIDSDELDEDLIDLYTKDMGVDEEKAILEIGKPAKSFDQIDFDRDDFDTIDQDLKNIHIDSKVKKSIKNKTPKKVLDLFKEDDDEDELERNQDDLNTNENKSSFEIRQEKMRQNIDQIHEQMLTSVGDAKPWQLKGEVTAQTRPQDSLLEEYLQFDHTTRQAPVQGQTTTETLERMIKQRIKDKAFDDVERKIKPVDMQYKYKKEVILDQERSKIGLGDVYEKDYLKQQEAAATTGGLQEKPTENVNNPKHDEIRKLMQSLFIKLDALSNFHFTPKAPMAELKVVSNMPSIAIEEVAPVNVADTNVLAPEEIKAKINSLPKSKSEEDKSDRNRKLRTKKLKNKTLKIEKEKRLQLAQALDPENAQISKKLAMNKLEKQSKNMSKNIKILKTDKKAKVNSAYRSSSAFFKQLQENTQIEKNVVKKKKIVDGETKSAKKFKL